MLENISMSDEVKNEWVNDPLNGLSLALANIAWINELFGTNAAISERDTQKAIEILGVKDMRILKGYSKEEQRDFEKLSKLDYPLNALVGSIREYAPEFERKIYNLSPYEERKALQDVADYLNGRAKFPDKKYYVHFVKEVDDSYLNRGENITFVGGKNIYADMKTQFTREEIMAIDPNLESFMEEVPESELAE